MKKADHISTGWGKNMRLPAAYRLVMLHIILGYSIFGVIWIAASDFVLAQIVQDPKVLMNISLIKGWVFVALCTLLIARVTQANLRQVYLQNRMVESAYEQLSESSAQLMDANVKLAAAESERTRQYESAMEYQRRLAESEQMRRLLADGANGGIWEMRGGQWLFNDRCLDLLGYSREQADQVKPIQLVHPQDCEEVLRRYQQHLAEHESVFSIEFRMKAQNGQYRWLHTRARSWWDEATQMHVTQGVNYDITDIREMPDHLNWVGTDPLTGLRTVASLRVDGLRAHLPHWADKLALLQINVGNLRFYNETYGREFSDCLLRKVAQRLGQLLQPGMLLYKRLEDNFLMIVPHREGEDVTTHLCEDILQLFAQPIQIEASLLYVGVSIGITTYPDHGMEVDVLLSCAEAAVKSAKANEDGHVAMFSFQLMRQQIRRNRISVKLGMALENGELSLHYQPQYSLNPHRIIGLEALLRWHNPDLGMVSPAEFIPIAQETQLILPIGDWVLDQACAFIQRTHAMLGRSDIVISVNICIHQLIQSDFVAKVRRILHRYQLPPQTLELEVVESALIRSFDSVQEKLQELRSHGVRIALDDFGTGYSSLSYISRLPIHTLKIDKSFVDLLPDGNGYHVLTDLVITLGEQMNLRVIAEGVETQEQLDYLAASGCEAVQGYLLSKPLAEKQVQHHLMCHFCTQQALDA